MEDISEPITNHAFWRVLKGHGYLGLLSYLCHHYGENDKQGISLTIRSWLAAKSSTTQDCSKKFYVELAMSAGRMMKYSMDNTKNRVIDRSDIVAEEKASKQTVPWRKCRAKSPFPQIRIKSEVEQPPAGPGRFKTEIGLEDVEPPPQKASKRTAPWRKCRPKSPFPQIRIKSEVEQPPADMNLPRITVLQLHVIYDCCIFQPLLVINFWGLCFATR